LFEEHPNLENVDWRFHVATTLAKDWKNAHSGTIWKEGDVLTTAVQVSYLKGSIWLGVPNTTAMFLNLSHELGQAPFLVGRCNRRQNILKQPSFEILFPYPYASIAF